MDKYVIDASVILKWPKESQEAYIREARYILRQIKDGDIHVYAPYFLLLEVTNVLYTNHKIPRKLVEQFIEELVSCGIHYRNFDISAISDILALQNKYDLTSYDAYYLSLAQTLMCPLLTFDKDLLKVKGSSLHPKDMRIPQN